MNIKGTNALKITPSEKDVFMKHLNNALRELNLANKQFDEIDDNRAVDYASYNLLAAKAKYSYLIQLAKEKNLSL